MFPKTFTERINSRRDLKVTTDVVWWINQERVPLNGASNNSSMVLLKHALLPRGNFSVDLNSQNGTYQASKFEGQSGASPIKALNMRIKVSNLDQHLKGEQWEIDWTIHITNYTKACKYKSWFIFHFIIKQNNETLKSCSSGLLEKNSLSEAHCHSPALFDSRLLIGSDL